MWPVFHKAVRDSRRTNLWLSIGMAAFALLAVSLYPEIVKQQEKLDELMREMPPVLIQMFAGDIDIETFTIADPAVYLQARFVTWLTLILGAVVMVQAFNAVTNAERNGTMDVLLALPISRRDMLLGRLLNTAATVFIVLTVSVATLLVSMLFVEELNLPVGRLALAIYSVFFLVMAQAGFTYMLVSLVPSGRQWAGALAYTLFYGSYLVYNFSATSDALQRIKPLLMFDYYSMGEIIRDGLQPGNIIVLGSLAVVCIGVAWWAIDHKELGV